MFYDDGVSFLLDSGTTPPDRHLHGACFCGVDLVIGADGAERYLADPGRTLVPGEDGHYILLTRSGASEWTLGTDFKGFSHLYWFNDENYWVVSNSLDRLRKAMSANGVAVAPNLGELAAFASVPWFARSVSTFETSTVGVRLLGSHECLRITADPSGATTITTVPLSTVVPDSDSGPTDYLTGLGEFLSIWSGRFRTLFSDRDMTFFCDISGGVDSRTVLSVALPVIRELNPRVRYYSPPGMVADFAVAQEVATASGITLNHTTPAEQAEFIARRERFGRALTAGERFGFWRDSHLGSYVHVTFPMRTQAKSFEMKIGGLGGEAHRHAYLPVMHEGSMEEAAETWRSHFTRPELFEQWRSSVLAADETLAALPGTHPNPMVRHHREFRDRFHSGSAGFWILATEALSSRHLARCSSLLDPEPFADGQVLSDIVYNSIPELLILPYDLPEKSLSGKAVRRLRSIPGGWDPLPAGEIYGGAPGPDVPLPGDEEFDTPLEFLLDEARRSIAGDRDLMDAVGLSNATESLLELEKMVSARAGNMAAQNLHSNGTQAHLLSLAASFRP